MIAADNHRSYDIYSVNGHLETVCIHTPANIALMNTPMYQPHAKNVAFSPEIVKLSRCVVKKEI